MYKSERGGFGATLHRLTEDLFGRSTRDRWNEWCVISLKIARRPLAPEATTVPMRRRAGAVTFWQSSPGVRP